MPSHQPQNTQNASYHPQQQLQPNMGDNAPHNPENQQPQPQPQHASCHRYPFTSGARQRLSPSDEVDHGVNGDEERTKYPTWQRVKWTDTMIRLLIMAVCDIVDEFGLDKSGPVGKEKSQKKEKWKPVSRAMMQMGHHVSPQQCQDKFNDLNKRFKRLNDILGQERACHVVANRGLLDMMDLPPKLKAEARKLLQSKHLYFKEMCGYYRHCMYGVGSRPAEEAAGAEGEGEYKDDEGAEAGCRNGNEQHGYEGGDCSGNMSRKRKRIGGHTASSHLMQHLSIETSKALQDGAKSAWEKKQWIKMHLLQLEEQKVRYQYQTLELEKQRLKWLKFSMKKEMELERAKLEIERKRLENKRMILLVQQKEIELRNIYPPKTPSVPPQG